MSAVLYLLSAALVPGFLGVILGSWLSTRSMNNGIERWKDEERLRERRAMRVELVFRLSVLRERVALLRPAEWLVDGSKGGPVLDTARFAEINSSVVDARLNAQSLSAAVGPDPVAQSLRAFECQFNELIREIAGFARTLPDPNYQDIRDFRAITVKVNTIISEIQRLQKLVTARIRVEVDPYRFPD